MRKLRIVLGLVIIPAIFLVTFQSEVISTFVLVSLNSAWMTSYLVPRILVLLLPITLSAIVIPLVDVSKLAKIGLGTFLFASCIGGYFSLNLPYIDDWNRTGLEMSNVNVSATAPIETFLDEQFGNYEGLVCLALPDCPYCISAVSKLERMQSRSNSMNYCVLVYANDSTGVQRFLNHIDSIMIPVFLAPKPDETYSLSRGRFPSFLYVKNGKVVYRWSNGQFGYPAMDWVENRLN